MAKQTKKQHDGKSTKITTPSRFGSHKKMVIKELDDDWVICGDEFGTYKTTKDRLDSGLADPRRYDQKRVNLEIEENKNETVSIE